MCRLAWFFFAFCLAAAGAYVAATSGALPEHVASHFGPGSQANAFMTRGSYRVFMLAFALGLPVVVAALIGLLPRIHANAINIPHKAYWLDPARRAATLYALSAHGAGLGGLLALFVAALHHVLVIANGFSPPRLPVEHFWILFIGFLAVIGLWMGTLYARFRNVS
jgi:uncharacterized membrane protein